LAAIARSLDTTGATRDLALGALVAALLWIKLTTPLVILPALAVVLAARRSIRVALARTGVIAVVGVAGFLVTWIAYTGTLGLPALAPGHPRRRRVRLARRRPPGVDLCGGQGAARRRPGARRRDPPRRAAGGGARGDSARDRVARGRWPVHEPRAGSGPSARG